MDLLLQVFVLIILNGNCLHYININFNLKRILTNHGQIAFYIILYAFKNIAHEISI